MTASFIHYSGDYISRQLDLSSLEDKMCASGFREGIRTYHISGAGTVVSDFESDGETDIARYRKSSSSGMLPSHERSEDFCWTL